VTSGDSWRSQETRAGWLDAQELGGARTGFAELATALGRRRELDGAVAAVSGKQRRKKEEQRRSLSFIGRQRRKEATCSSLLMPVQSQRRPWARLERRRKAAGGDSCPTALFHLFTKMPFNLTSKLLPNLCNNSKIFKNKSCSKSKVLQLCFYNHPLIRSTF